MVYSLRKRTQENAAREAAGENLWTDEFNVRATIQLDELWEVFYEKQDRYIDSLDTEVARKMRLYGGWKVPDRLFPGSFFTSFKQEVGTEFLLDLLECIATSIPSRQNPQGFAESANTILNHHRLAFRFVDKEIVPFESDELHHEVVEPTLRLLASKKFSNAHDSYLKALREIQNSDPGDAITDAGTALQHTLEQLGCEGNTTGKLLTDAKAKGLLGKHDQRLINGVKEFGEWAHADRNETGDAHHHPDAVLADAWLMVHVVGALIVRLVDPGGARGESES